MSLKYNPDFRTFMQLLPIILIVGFVLFFILGIIKGIAAIVGCGLLYKWIEYWS